MSMITEIGITAGDIWHYLEQRNEVTFQQLAAGVDRSRDTLLMSLGWLAREGHVILNQDGESYTIVLRR